MTLLNKEQQSKIADLIRDIETKTDAELVTVLARRSDRYSYIPLLWAAGFALLLPLVALLSPFWLETLDIVLLQWGTFLLLAALFQIPALRILLIPKSVRFWRAANMARRQFLDNNLHHTDSETGILIFVSEAEHYVEIIADRGINQLVDNDYWRKLVDEFIRHVKAGQTYQGFDTCIRHCGEVLAEKLPATHARDELPNHLVVIE